MVSHGADINAQDNMGNTIIHKASVGHSIKKISILKTLLRLGCNPNIKNQDGFTPLHIYQLAGSTFGDGTDQEVIYGLIDAGADLEARDENGKTPLHRAVMTNKNAELVRLLFQHPTIKPNIAAKTMCGGKTALHLVLQPGIRDAYQGLNTLLEFGADPTWKDDDGNTLLHELGARFHDSAEDTQLIERLIECKVPFHSTNKKGRTAAHILPIDCRNNSSGARPTSRDFVFTHLQRIDPSFDINAQDSEGYTPLHLAAVVSEPRVFSLIQAGANPGAKSHNGRTPLHCAALGRQSGILAMIIHLSKDLNLEIDVNGTDVNGRTPLHEACRSGCPESVRILVNAGADIDARDSSNHTPLIACAEFLDEQKMWPVQIQQGIANAFQNYPPNEFKPDIDADEFRHTCNKASARGTSCMYGDNHEKLRVGVIAKILIDAGADTKGAVEAARKANDVELLAALDDKMRLDIQTLSIDESDNKTPGWSISWEDRIPDINETTIDALIEKGVDFTRPLQNPLQEGNVIARLVRHGMTEFVAKMISKARLFDDPSFTVALDNNVHSRFRPLLQVACSQPFWNMEMVKLLVTEGDVDVNAHRQIREGGGKETAPGATALHVLAKGASWWHTEAIRYLIKNGAFVVCISIFDHIFLVGSHPSNMLVTDIVISRS